MAQTIDVGRLFFHVIDLGPAPLLHLGRSQEISPPFRASRVLIVRLWRSKGLVIGWWRKTGLSEDEALTVALQAWGVDLYEDDDLDDPEVRACIRENVAKSTTDLDQEWTIVDALGLGR